MTREEAGKILNVPPDAKEEEVQQAFRNRAKQTHPDTNDSSSTRAFQEACDARDTLLGRGGSKSGDSEEHPGDKASSDQGPTSSNEGVDPVEIMKGFLERNEYVVTFDGFEEAVSVKGATDQATFREMLGRRDLTFKQIENEVTLDPLVRESGIGRAVARAALNKMVDDFRHKRREETMMRLWPPLGAHGREMERARFTEIAKASFCDDPLYVVAVLLHFVWQVLRKVWVPSIENHLMPLIWSLAEGTGKTEFVKWFLRPLRELCSPIIGLDDFLDTRFFGVMRYPAVFLDDISSIKAHQIPHFNRIASAPDLGRRPSGGSETVRAPNRSSLIATGNRHNFGSLRRVAPLEFRDGRVDPNVWSYAAVEDATRFWRIVDPKVPSPIIPFLPQLRARRGQKLMDDTFLEWCESFDPRSADAKAIRTSKGFMAGKLHELFVAQTGEPVSANEFAGLMDRYFADPRSPFEAKVKNNAGAYYALNQADRLRR